MELPVFFRKLRPDAIPPRYATDGAAAADLCAALDAPVTLNPGERALIPTGLALSCGRNDIVMLLFSRSGMGIKNGISLSNSVGVIDSDYRGEIKVGVINHGSEPYTVSPGDRIAQLAFFPVLRAEFSEAEKLDETARGEGGFGSTGVR